MFCVSFKWYLLYFIIHIYKILIYLYIKFPLLVKHKPILYNHLMYKKNTRMCCTTLYFLIICIRAAAGVFFLLIQTHTHTTHTWCIVFEGYICISRYSGKLAFGKFCISLQDNIMNVHVCTKLYQLFQIDKSIFNRLCKEK